MADVAELDLFGDGKWILAFDGRVLEIFGCIHPNWNVNNLVDVDSWRIHVTQLNVEVTGPDKHGLRNVAFCTLSDPHGAFKATKLDESQWSRLQPFVATLATATKASAFQALTSEHDLHLGSLPDDARNAVVSDLQGAGIAIDPKSLLMRFTEPAQFDAALEIYQRHGLLPPDASIA